MMYRDWHRKWEGAAGKWACEDASELTAMNAIIQLADTVAKSHADANVALSKLACFVCGGAACSPLVVAADRT